MYCHDCGTANTVDSKYCKECGARVNDGYRAMMQSVQDPMLAQTEEDTDALTRLLDMAFWHNQAGNIDAAITASEAALALSPHSTTAHSLLGSLYEKKGDDAEAIRHFEAVLERNPDSAADAAKLDQLRRGVHVKAVAPPVAHQWLPPALLKFTVRARQRAGAAGTGDIALPTFVRLDRIDPQRRPLYAAGAATLLVLVAGLLAAHPWAQAETVRSASDKTYPITAPSPTSVRQSAYAAPTSLPPVVMLPSSPASAAGRTSYPAPVLSSHDPFAGHVPTDSISTASNDLSSSPWSLPSVRSRAASRNRRVAGRDLPPLRLSALPADNTADNAEGIAPAPVSLPDGLTSAASLAASVPQHTVMVSSLSGANSASNSASNNGPLADPPSHIRITVHQVRDSSPAPSDASSADGGGSPANAGAAQQRALALQQGGDYRQARQAYQTAIRAYQTQIAAGQDVETARRGLAACQTGLQICQQSQ